MLSPLSSKDHSSWSHFVVPLIPFWSLGSIALPSTVITVTSMHEESNMATVQCQTPINQNIKVFHWRVWHPCALKFLDILSTRLWVGKLNCCGLFNVAIVQQAGLLRVLQKSDTKVELNVKIFIRGNNLPVSEKMEREPEKKSSAINMMHIWPQVKKRWRKDGMFFSLQKKYQIGCFLIYIIPWEPPNLWDIATNIWTTKYFITV